MTPAHGGPGQPAGPAPGRGGRLPADLAAALAEVAPGGARFGHREHIHLAFLAVQRYGPAAPQVVARWLQQLAALHGAPHKFHATVTRAWVTLVAHHAAACPPGTGFAAFASEHPALLDKDLLSRHYSARLLAAPAAAAGWAEPDLAAFPPSPPPGCRSG